MPTSPYGSAQLPGSPTGNTPVPSVGGSNAQLKFSDIDWSGVGSGIVDFFKNNWESLVKAGLATMTTVEAIKNSQKSDQFTQKALDMAGADYADRGKYRDLASSKLMTPNRPNLSPLFNDPGNPYKLVNRSIPVVGGPAPTNAPAGPATPPPGAPGTGAPNPDFPWPAPGSETPIWVRPPMAQNPGQSFGGHQPQQTSGPGASPPQTGLDVPPNPNVDDPNLMRVNRRRLMVPSVGGMY
jgi:hypothetical protein